MKMTQIDENLYVLIQKLMTSQDIKMRYQSFMNNHFSVQALLEWIR